jgi:hypothetical protein
MLSPIVVTFVRPISTYTEDASIAPGDTVTYTWAKDNQRDCGKFGSPETASNTATWWHPDAAGGGDCPNEDVHPGIITVTVSDGTWECTAVYPDGSAPGTGPAPQPCTQVATDTPSATPTQTSTTTNTPTVTSTPTNTRVVTATPVPTATVSPQEKAYWASAAKWEKNIGTGAKAVGLGLAGAGILASATGVGALPGLPTAVAGFLLTGVGLLTSVLSDEMSDWAKDPPDMAYHLRANAAITVKPLPAKGIPPAVAAAYQALAMNYTLQTTELKNAMTSIDRATGATQQHVLACVVYQYDQAVADAKAADKAIHDRPGLLKKLITALSAAGIHRISAGTVRMAEQWIAVHGIPRQADTSLQQLYGAQQARALEATLLRSIKNGTFPVQNLDLIATLKGMLNEPPFPAAAYVVTSTGHDVQANPRDCVRSGQ